MKKMIKSPLAVAMSAAFISTMTATTANAEANPFGMTEMTNGYMQIAEAGKSGEMACGANMGGMTKPKTPEGACAGQKSTPAAPAATKSGEGKCGNMMEGDKMKKGMENVCGAQMKGKEGACGEMMKGEKMKMPETPAK